MIFDLQSLFSDGQAITTGTENSTNVIDNGPVGTPKHAKAPVTRDVGKSHNLELVIQAVEDFAAGTSVKAALETSDVENFGSGVVTLAETAAVPVADLKAGYRFKITTFPEGSKKRYLRLKYTSVGTFTDGKVTAGLVFGRGNWEA